MFPTVPVGHAGTRRESFGPVLTVEGFRDAALFRQVSELGHPFPRVGIAGHPESHPVIDDDVAIQSMWDKRQHPHSRE